MYDKPENAKPTKAAQTIYEMNKLSVSQSDGIVRKGDGTIVGSQKWLLNVDYSLDTKQGEDFVVNAVSEEDAIAKVEKLLEGVAKRKDMELGSIFTIAPINSPPAEPPIAKTFAGSPYCSEIKCLVQLIKSVKVFIFVKNFPSSYQFLPKYSLPLTWQMTNTNPLSNKLNLTELK